MSEIGPRGSVRSRTAPLGGAHLDVLLAARLGITADEARRVRERWSLRPQEAWRPDPAVVGEVLTPVCARIADLVAAWEAGPVLLVGGVARLPALAELVDAAARPGVDVLVAARPEAAAVLGALRTVVGGDRGRAPGTAGPALPRLLPPVRRRPRRAVLLGLGVAGLALAVALLFTGTWWQGTERPDEPAPRGVLVQYGYELDLPAGWAHTGGRPERRRVLLTPVAAPEGSDLVVVERSPLGYDTAAEPQRAAAELRAVYDDALAAGASLTGYDASASFAARAVTTYTEHGDRVTTDWYVVLEGDAQLSVGCQSTPVGRDAVRRACAVVVASVRPT